MYFTANRPGGTGGGGGSGDVVGPATAVVGNIPVFDATSGKVIKDSSKKLDDYIQSAMIKIRDPFSGVPNGVLTEFTLNELPVLDSERVFLAGLRLYPGEHYSIDGNKITFVTPPPTGDLLVIEYLAQEV